MDNNSLQNEVDNQGHLASSVPTTTSTDSISQSASNSATPAQLSEDAQQQPLTAQQIALGILATVSLIWFLKFAENVIVPVLLGLILSYSLRPFVEWLQRSLYIPRAIGALMLLLMLFGGVILGLWNLRDDVATVSSELPKAARMIREFVATPQTGSPSLMSDIRQATRELDQASAALSIDQSNERKELNVSSATATTSAGATTTARHRAAGASDPLPPARASSPSVAEHLQNFVNDRIGKLVSVATTLGVAALLAFLLLCAGTEHRKNLLQIVGQSLTRKKITLTILNDIHAQVQYYLAATAATNIALALSTWALFFYFGIERALLWGLVAGLLHLIPYVGTALFLGLCFLIGLVSLNGFWPAFNLTLIWLLIEFIIGFGLNNYIQTRSSRINSAALFVGFLLFSWLWGGWGLIVAAPVLAALKAVSDRVPSLKEIGTLLS